MPGAVVKNQGRFTALEANKGKFATTTGKGAHPFSTCYGSSSTELLLGSSSDSPERELKFKISPKRNQTNVLCLEALDRKKFYILRTVVTNTDLDMLYIIL